MKSNILDGDVITLWTVQGMEAYHRLMDTHVLTVSTDEYLMFPEEYSWIKSAMIKHGVIPSSYEEVWPIWAWYLIDGKRHAPDLRCTGFAAKGTPLVRIEFEIERKNVLLSDFSLWHSVLNKWFIGENEEEENEYWNNLDNFPRKRLETSWEKIFLIDEIRNNPWLCTPELQSIQATFWRLEKGMVRNVKFFTER